MGFSGSSLDDDEEDGGSNSSRANGFGIPCRKPTAAAAAQPPNTACGYASAAIRCFYMSSYGIRMLLSRSSYLTSFFLPFYHRREQNPLVGVCGSWMAYANGFDDTLATISWWWWYHTTAAAAGPIIQYSSSSSSSCSSTPFSPTVQQHRNSKGALSFSLLLWIHSF